MANTKNNRPPQFFGNASGLAWWREFTKWVVESGSQGATELNIFAFEAFMEGKAAEWYKALPDQTKSSLSALKAALETAYPGDTAEAGILDYAMEDPVTAYQQFLNKGMEDTKLTSPVEIDIRQNGQIETAAYFHEWVRAAYKKALSVPSSEMSAEVKGGLLKAALPREIRSLLPKKARMTIAEVAKAVVDIDPADVDEQISHRDRLARLEQRAPVRFQAQNVLAPALPGTYAPVPATGVAAPTKTGANDGRAIRGNQHLVFPNTPHGREQYNKAMASFNATFGETGAVSAYKPMPLTPGTLPPGRDVCDQCGQAGHLRTACTNKPLPEREVKFRGVNSSAQRAEDRVSRDSPSASVRLLQAAEEQAFDPADWYYDQENESGQA
ncbi:unnamed protein product [Parajaminaea phylloscopi]